MKNAICFISIFFIQLSLLAQGGNASASRKGTAVINEVLETAYLLTAIGKYEGAHAYFVYALRDTSNKEVYNNAGVVAILAARNYFRPNEPEVKFYYPVQLGLNKASARGGNEFKEICTRLLRNAIDHFSAAIRLDTGYAPAYLNKACAHAMLDELQQAEKEANRAAALPGYDKTVVDARILMGILYARQGDAKKAEESFSSAAKQGSTLAGYNLAILMNKETPEPSEKYDLPAGIETIDKISLADPYNFPEPDPNSEIALNSQIRLYHNLHPGPNSRFYFSDNTATGQQTYFLLTGPGYTGQTLKKLRIGAEKTEIDASCGIPIRSIEAPTGQIRVYPSIILILNSGGKLASWALWGETE